MKRSMPGSDRLTGTPKDRPPSCPASINIALGARGRPSRRPAQSPAGAPPVCV